MVLAGEPGADATGCPGLESQMPVIDLSFVLVGTTIPLDHGYALFSALCRIVPELHGDTKVGVHPIRDRQTAPGVLSLTDRSRLKIRVPSENAADAFHHGE
jgi:CRISPR-associated protein Cas6